MATDQRYGDLCAHLFYVLANEGHLRQNSRPIKVKIYPSIYKKYLLYLARWKTWHESELINNLWKNEVDEVDNVANE